MFVQAGSRSGPGLAVTLPSNPSTPVASPRPPGAAASPALAPFGSPDSFCVLEESPAAAAPPAGAAAARFDSFGSPDSFGVLEERPAAAAVDASPAATEFDDAENAGAPAPASKAALRRAGMLATLLDAPDQMLLEPSECDPAGPESVPASPARPGAAAPPPPRGAVSAKASPARGLSKPPLSPSRPALVRPRPLS